MNGHVLIDVHGLTFSYPDAAGRGPRPADTGPLLSIDRLSVAAGEIVVVTGDNGSGKTTLLRLVAGLLIPNTGNVKRAAIPVLVHQRPYVFAESVYANVAWPLRIRGVARTEVRKRVGRTLELLGLQAISGRWAPALSGGEKQRVAISRALVIEPQALLLDEPTSNIDPSSVLTIESVLSDLAASGVGVMMSTHNIASAYRLATSLVPLADGRVQSLDVNIIRGRTLSSAHDHIGRFESESGPTLYCPAGERVCRTAVVRMDDIVLSREPVATSAQNLLRGSITAVQRVGHELVRVDIYAGLPLASLITQRSVKELRLAPGGLVYLTFKASAVELY
jgi:tungstate transport system ATP-binding protein